MSVSVLPNCSNFQNCSDKTFFCGINDSIRYPSETELKCCAQSQQLKFINDYNYIFIGNILAIILIGGTGHLLNLIAVPYVYFRYPNRFLRRWNQITLLLLHLSFCDLAYILIGLPFLLDYYINHEFTFSPNLCSFTGTVRNLNAFTSFYTVATIAFIRMTKDLGNNDSQWTLRGTILHCSCAWIISFIILAPALFNVQWGGYNWGRIVPSPFTGMCDYNTCIRDVQSIRPYSIFRLIGTDFPFVLILMLYAVILTVKLRRMPAQDNQIVNISKIHKTVWLSVLPHVICIIPLQVAVRVRWVTGPKCSLFSFHWYMWIYVANFLFYIVPIQDFREMYKILLKDIICFVAIKRKN